MLRILAHRGNVAGPRPATENSHASIANALAHGWGVETDIRRAADGRFYLSHDETGRVDDRVADEAFAILRAHPAATVALNVKELGGEAALINFLEGQGVLSQIFLFDMELLEARAGETAAVFRALSGSVQLAARVSDRGESIARALAIDAASIVWLDEMDSLWCTERDVRALKDAGRTVYAVSPDLHHFPSDRTRQRWLDFHRWGVDGICTDYAAALEGILAAVEGGHAA